MAKKPTYVRAPQPLPRARRSDLDWAINHMRKRAAGQNLAATLAKKMFDLPRQSRDYTIDDYVNLTLSVADGLYSAGNVTDEEYFFLVAYHLEQCHEARLRRGDHDEKLSPILDRMKAVEKSHNLQDGEFWLLKDAPTSYRKLSQEYSRLSDAEYGRVMEAFGRVEMAEVWCNSRDTFDARYELGRRAFFSKEAHVQALKDLVRRYETEAAKSASVGAFYAACMLLGAASESRLLLKCLERPNLAAQAVLRLSSRKRPKTGDPRTWSLSALVSVCGECGWLPNIRQADISHITTGWLRRLRELRNLVHPGRHLRDQPHAVIGEPAYEDARAAYLAMCHALASSRRRRETVRKA